MPGDIVTLPQQTEPPKPALDYNLKHEYDPLQFVWDKLQQTQTPGHSNYKKSVLEMLLRESTIQNKSPYFLLRELMNDREAQGPGGEGLLPNDQVTAISRSPEAGGWLNPDHPANRIPNDKTKTDESWQWNRPLNRRKSVLPHDY